MPSIQVLSTATSDDAASCKEVKWIDIDRSDPASREWLTTQTDISERAKLLLLENANVNRREKLEEGFIVCLCGGNLKRQLESAGHVSASILVETDRVITAHSEPAKVFEDTRAHLERDGLSLTPVEFLAHVAVRRAQQLEEFITQLSAETDELEESLLTDGDDPPLKRLSGLRYQAFCIRRQLVPLRDFLNFMIADKALQVSNEEASALILATEQIVRYLESLDDCRERAQLLHDQMEAQLSAVMNRVSYNLTVVATVFLPLSFITGLLGMNVAGIPDEHNPWGFAIVCVTMIVVAGLSWFLLRWRRLV